MSQDETETETVETEAPAELSEMISGIDDMVRQGLVEVLGALDQQQQAASAKIGELRSELAKMGAALAERIEQEEPPEAVLPPMAAPVAEAVPVAQAVPSQPAPTVVDAGDWETTLLGVELCGDAMLAQDRQVLLGGLVGQDPRAQALVGQLLAFRACTDQRRAQLLKEVGEAYYAWRPETAHGDDYFRESLINYLAAGCQAIGANNTIELVRPGDRFDSKRHNAKSRGIEITGVYGWIVLRENGSVYTKASVEAS